MLKKTVGWTVFAALVGLLVAGALIRTWDRSAHTAQAGGFGQNQYAQVDGQSGDQGNEKGQGRVASTDGQGNGWGSAAEDDASLDAWAAGSEDDTVEWLTLSGVVVAVDESEMVVAASDGSEIVIEGRPLQYATEQQFTAAIGDNLTLTGFYEDGEFKAGVVGNDTSGQTVTLRDESGRPGWSGRGRGR